MAKAKRSRRTKQQRRISPADRRKLAGIALLLVALITGLSLLSPAHGTLTGAWLRFLRQAFGWAAYLLPLLLAAAGFWFFLTGMGRAIHVSSETTVALFLLLISGMGLLHYSSTAPEALAQTGGGGGTVGLWISQNLIHALGDVGALLALLTTAIVGLASLFHVSLGQIVQKSTKIARSLLDEYRRRRAAANAYVSPAADRSAAARVASMVEKGKGRSQTSHPTQIRTESAASSASTTDEGDLVSPQVAGLEGQWQLPRWEDILVESTEQELSQAEIRTKVRIIEETLANFGVPGKVVEVNQGPTVTQFGVEPGFVEQKDAAGKLRKVKVKVSRISALSNDLALSLAASPIRIEAPVPGRSMVGIEVPNTSISKVTLRSVMDSDAFREEEGRLRIALGQDVAGQPVAADLAQMPHLLIAGATGSGKSVCINAITACLLFNNSPDDLRLVMVDPKMVELTNYNGIPHLIVPVVVEIERVVATLKWVTGEMERRYRIFAKAGARNIEAYNANHPHRPEHLPYIVVLIDELADLMMAAPEEAERSICRLAQLARATGIHLVIATQRPSVDVITGLIKANFPARIGFTVFSGVDSRVILDATGAERLLGRGDMLYMASDSSKLVRMQGCYISDAELEKLVAHWRDRRNTAPLPPGAGLVQQPLWEEMIAREAESAGHDELLEQATQIVRQKGRASISLLQRKLSIGYSRAARLIDQMEAQGIVGPDEGPNRGRQVYDQPQDGEPDNADEAELRPGQ
jgi:S-DNA-T family DNA segregation ATPase FtsK/SpoIIIE